MGNTEGCTHALYWRYDSSMHAFLKYCIFEHVLQDLGKSLLQCCNSRGETCMILFLLMYNISYMYSSHHKWYAAVSPLLSVKHTHVHNYKVWTQPLWLQLHQMYVLWMWIIMYFVDIWATVILLILGYSALPFLFDFCSKTDLLSVTSVLKLKWRGVVVFKNISKCS